MLVALAAAGRKRGTIAGLLSGLRWSAKVLGLPLSPASPLHDAVVKALPRVRGQLAWLHPSSLCRLASLPLHSLRDRVFTALAIVAYFHALRVSEALRVTPSHFEWLSPSRAIFTILRSKDASGDLRPERVALQAEAVPWARLLCDLCAASQSVTSWRPRTRDADCTWHSLRRGVATYMWHLGLPLEAIMRRGGWQNAGVCRQYIYPWVE
eukprot:gene6928-5365_t